MMKKTLLKPLLISLLLANLPQTLLAANTITNIELLSNSQEEQILAISFSEPLLARPAFQSVTRHVLLLISKTRVTRPVKTCCNSTEACSVVPHWSKVRNEPVWCSI